MKRGLKCALCGSEIEGEPLIFEGAALCDKHSGEIGQDKWHAIGHYRREHLGTHRMGVLEAWGQRCLLLKLEEPPGYRLFIPEGDKKKVYRIFSVMHRDIVLCSGCNTEYSADEPSCPICGKSSSYRP